MCKRPCFHINAKEIGIKNYFLCQPNLRFQLRMLWLVRWLCLKKKTWQLCLHVVVCLSDFILTVKVEIWERAHLFRLYMAQTLYTKRAQLFLLVFCLSDIIYWQLFRLYSLKKKSFRLYVWEEGVERFEKKEGTTEKIDDIERKCFGRFIFLHNIKFFSFKGTKKNVLKESLHEFFKFNLCSYNIHKIKNIY